MNSIKVLVVVALMAMTPGVYAGFFGPFDPTPVPEPSPLLLVAAGAAVIALLRRYRRK
jgi:hypothetical protein